MITGKQLRDAFLSPQIEFLLLSGSWYRLKSKGSTMPIEETLKYHNMNVHCSGDIPVSEGD